MQFTQAMRPKPFDRKSCDRDRVRRACRPSCVSLPAIQLGHLPFLNMYPHNQNLVLGEANALLKASFSGPLYRCPHWLLNVNCRSPITPSGISLRYVQWVWAFENPSNVQQAEAKVGNESKEMQWLVADNRTRHGMSSTCNKINIWCKLKFTIRSCLQKEIHQTKH